MCPLFPPPLSPPPSLTPSPAVSPSLTPFPSPYGLQMSCSHHAHALHVLSLPPFTPSSSPPNSRPSPLRASNCEYKHSNMKWGENIALGSSSLSSLVIMWYTAEVRHEWKV